MKQMAFAAANDSPPYGTQMLIKNLLAKNICGAILRATHCFDSVAPLRGFDTIYIFGSRETLP